MARHDALIAEKRRILQLETLYDLAIALHAQRPEQELVDELLQRVCAVLDPGAAVAVTRDAYGGARGVASVGWLDDLPAGDALLASPIWRELLTEGHTLTRSHGALAGRPYEQLLAAPLSYRGVFLGYVAVLDKEVRGDSDPSFTPDDRRFLDSVTALAAAALDAARQVERLETQRERLEEENKALKGRLVQEVSGRRIAALAPPMRRVLEVVERVAPRGVSVLVRGESGTGKELVAKMPPLPLRPRGSADRRQLLGASRVAPGERAVRHRGRGRDGRPGAAGKVRAGRPRHALSRRDRRHADPPRCGSCAPSRSGR